MLACRRARRACKKYISPTPTPRLVVRIARVTGIRLLHQD
jgi:hypothetical protein